MPSPSVSVGALLRGTRARSYVKALPLFTRLVLLAIVVFWVLGLVPALDIRNWGALVPDLMNLKTCRFLFFIVRGFGWNCDGNDRTGRDGRGRDNNCWEGKEKEKGRKGERSGLTITCSIPNEHVPVYTSQLIPRGYEHPGTSAVAGAL